MSQKALTLPAKFGEWTVADWPIPEPGPNQVLVKIEAVALNPVDWLIQKLGVIVEQFPAVVGEDAAGVVEKVGSEVTRFKKGDRVFYGSNSTFKQYDVMDADFVAKIPDNVSTDQAASVPLGFATAALALYSKGSAGLTPPWEKEGATLYKGKPAFIVGGASSVGQYAIQLAKLAGHAPIVTTASAHNTAHLLSLGATHVLPRTLSSPEIHAKLAEITKGVPIPYVYGAIADDVSVALGYDAVAPGGTFITVHLGASVLKAPPKDGKRAVSVFASTTLPENRETGMELYKWLTGWLESGAIKPNPIEVLPGGFAGIPAGLVRLEAGKVSGTKLIARPHETP